MRRAMQGGTIDGKPAEEIDRVAKELSALLIEQMKAHDSPPEHRQQELASLLVQTFIQLTDNPAAFAEGALTQLGWQLGIRSGDNVLGYMELSARWIGNGFSSARLEPLCQPVAGRG